MSSITRTVTLVEQPAVLQRSSLSRLVFHDRAKRWDLKLEELLTKMQEASRLLPSEHSINVLEMLREWEGAFQSESRIHSNVDEEKMEAIYDLCCLHYNLVWVAGQMAEDGLVWKGFIESFKELMKEQLLEGQELESLLDFYAKRIAEQPVLEVFNEVEAAEERSFDTINHVAGLFGHGSAMVRDQLAEVYEEEERSLDEVYDEIDALKREVDELGNRALSYLEHIADGAEAVSKGAFTNSSQVASLARSLSTL